jgi:hypothetical protein
MKILSITLIAALLAAADATAQVNFGLKGGLNFYNLNTDPDNELDAKIGFHLGALAHIHLSDQFAFQPELVYSAQGAKSDANGDDMKLNLNYINIPLLFQYMFDNGFRLQAGPQFGILASAKAKSGDASIDVKDSFNTLDVSLPLGVGYVTPSGFGIDARYNFGLSNINEDDDSKARNRGFQIGVFYQFQHD